jgi:hypothetical protein
VCKTGSTSCAVKGFGITGAEPSGSTVRESVSIISLVSWLVRQAGIWLGGQVGSHQLLGQLVSQSVSQS